MRPEPSGPFPSRPVNPALRIGRAVRNSSLPEQGGGKELAMPFSDREMMARLIQCEAGGEGDAGMRAVATVIMNRATVPYGEFFRVSQGGNVRNIMEQRGQFNCMTDTLRSGYNPQNIWNMSPEAIHYEIADWALGGGRLSAVANSLFFYNPYSPECAPYFPPNRIGVIPNRINQHCFYIPTELYKDT